VRCGTTTLANHLSSLPGSHGPFCAFIHPLDGKESFYYSGHYFGVVHPYFYRAMFPLKLTRWASQAAGRPFLAYDACAQYLTGPCTPALMRASCGPNVPIFVCLREPVAQNVSWWRYEQAAVAWGDSMGLSTTHAAKDRKEYPPATLESAHALSSGQMMARMYAEAEALVGSTPATGQPIWVLPNWAITWPNGSLRFSVFFPDTHICSILTRTV
jgi:hypothetical protein